MPSVSLIGQPRALAGTHAVLSGGKTPMQGTARAIAYARAALIARRRLRGSLVAPTVVIGVIPATRPDYLTLLQNLLPPGAAWTRERDSEMTALLSALAFEFERVHDRAQALLDESDPSRTYELLADWERVAGLPDAYLSPATIDGRRQALIARLTFRGDQSRAAYIAAAQQLGYAVTINEFRPYDCLSTCINSITQGLWVFTWQVVAATGSDDALLEGVFRSRAPLQTNLLFKFT